MRKIILFVFLFVTSFQSIACSICGCGGSNVYFGSLPNFNNHFISIRYHYSQFHTQLADDPTQFSTNHYNSIELLAGYKVAKNFKVLAFLPYHSNKQIDDDGTSYQRGLGDITLIGQYRLLDKIGLASGKKVVEQQLWIGGGIKLPTGSFNADPADVNTTIADINAQLGTGSVDYLVNGLYTLTVDRIGLTTSASYKINTPNASDYKYGNKLTANCIASYQAPIAKNTLSPGIGIGYESIGSNTLGGSKIQFTGSHVTTALIGLEFGVKKIVLGINVQAPLEQNFAEGQTQMQWKTMAHISFAL